MFVGHSEVRCFRNLTSWWLTSEPVHQTLGGAVKPFLDAEPWTWRKRAATTAQRLYSTNKLNAAVDSVSLSKNLPKLGISYRFRANIPNEIPAVGSLCKTKVSPLFFVRQQFPTQCTAKARSFIEYSIVKCQIATALLFFRSLTCYCLNCL